MTKAVISPKPLVSSFTQHLHLHEVPVPPGASPIIDHLQMSIPLFISIFAHSREGPPGASPRFASLFGVSPTSGPELSHLNQAQYSARPNFVSHSASVSLSVLDSTTSIHTCFGTCGFWLLQKGKSL